MRQSVTGAQLIARLIDSFRADTAHDYGDVRVTRIALVAECPRCELLC